MRTAKQKRKITTERASLAESMNITANHGYIGLNHLDIYANLLILIESALNPCVTLEL